MMYNKKGIVCDEGSSLVRLFHQIFIENLNEYEQLTQFQKKGSKIKF